MYILYFIRYTSLSLRTVHVIRFTFEIKDQNNFSFLDIKFIRNTEKKAFETSVYRKSTFSGVFTNFKRFIPMTYKFGLLETVLSRSFSR